MKSEHRLEKSYSLSNEIKAFLKLPHLSPDIKSMLEKANVWLERWDGSEWHPYVFPTDYQTIGSDNIQ